MAIGISNLTVPANAPANTVIGNLTLRDASGANLAARYQLTGNSAGFFTLTGPNLMTTRAALPPGFYSVRIGGTATNVRFSAKGYFVIQVTSA